MFPIRSLGTKEWEGILAIAFTFLLLMVAGAGSQGMPRHSPAERAPLRVEDYFTPEQVALGKKYEGEKYLFFFADLLLTFGILALLTFTGLSSWLFSWADAMAGGRDWLARLLFLALVLVLLALVTFPLEIWEDYLHEHAYRLSDQSFQGWLWDQVKGWLVGFVLTLPLAYGLFFLIGRYPHGWWIPAGLAAFAFSVIFTYLSPVLIDPIFNTFKPVANQELKGRLVSLANHAGIRVKEVLEIDASRQTKKYNAYFAGLGPTKRIVIYDTFLRDGSIAEIESVLAHEIGHWQHGHLWKGILLSGVASFGFFFLLARALEYASTSQLFPFYAPHDVAAFPFILLFAALLSFLSSPVASGISRHFERQADWTALILTRDTQTFLEVERKLALRNLSDIDPPPLIEWAFHSHPSTVHRMEMALEYAQQEKSLQ